MLKQLKMIKVYKLDKLKEKWVWTGTLKTNYKEVYNDGFMVGDIFYTSNPMVRDAKNMEEVIDHA